MVITKHILQMQVLLAATHPLEVLGAITFLEGPIWLLYSYVKLMQATLSPSSSLSMPLCT